MVSATPRGTVVLVGTMNGTDVSCNDSPQRLPPTLVTPYDGVGIAARVLLFDGNGDGNEDVLALLANGSVGVSFGSRNGSDLSSLRFADFVV